jgi:hypothetical protein
MKVTDLVFGLVLAGIAAVMLLLFSDDPLGSAAAAVAVCFAIGVGWSRYWRWREESDPARSASTSVASRPWLFRAALEILALAVILTVVTRLADALVLRETTAEVIFWVLFGLGAVVILVGTAAEQRDLQGSGRPSQSS